MGIRIKIALSNLTMPPGRNANLTQGQGTSKETYPFGAYIP